MAALWILGILLALIIVILLIRVGVRIRLGDELHVSACVGPIKLQLLPKPEKKDKKKKPKKKKKSGKKKEKKKSDAKKTEKPKKKKKLGLTFDDIRSAVPALFESLKRGLRKTRKRLRVHPLDLSVTFAGDDPAKVAEMYGWTSAAMWTIMPEIQELVRMPDPHIHLDTDFSEYKTRAEGEIGLSFQIRDLFAIAFAFGVPVLKWLLPFMKARKAREKAARQKKAAEAAEIKNKEEKKSETTAE